MGCCAVSEHGHSREYMMTVKSKKIVDLSPNVVVVRFLLIAGSRRDSTEPCTKAQMFTTEFRSARSSRRLGNRHIERPPQTPLEWGGL